jgi:hypothetical protein
MSWCCHRVYPTELTGHVCDHLSVPYHPSHSLCHDNGPFKGHCSSRVPPTTSLFLLLARSHLWYRPFLYSPTICLPSSYCPNFIRWKQHFIPKIWYKGSKPTGSESWYGCIFVFRRCTVRIPVGKPDVLSEKFSDFPPTARLLMKTELDV